MNKLKIAGLTVVLIIFFISCTDDPLNVGFELLPNVDLLEAGADTLHIYGYVAKGYPGYALNPSATAANYSTDKCPIGHVIDPIFGNTWADVTMEILFDETTHYEYDNNVINYEFVSCKLYLKIDPELTFGNEGSFNFNIYPLKKVLSHQNSTSYQVKSEDFDYDQNLSISTNHNLYIDKTDIPGLDSNSYYLIVDLDESYFSKLMDTTFINETGIYDNEIGFLNQIPGFYLKPYAIDEYGALENFYISGSNIILEYDWTYNDINGADSVVRKYNNYAINKYQGIFRNQSNYFPEGPFGGILGDTLSESDNIYIQSMGGIRGYIHIPELEILKQSKSDSIGINFAEVVLPINPDFFDTVNYYLPPRISLLDKITNGFRYIIDDDPDRVVNPGYSSGYLDVENKEYRVNVTEFVHRYIQGNTSSTGWLYVSPSKLNQNTFSSIEYKAPGRAVLNSGNSSNPPFLRIIYTNTNN